MKLGNNYKKCWEFLVESKRYIWFTVVVFVLFTFIGFVFPVFFEVEIMEFLEKLTLEFEGLSVFGTILKIFLNNLRASFFAIVLGVILGLFPLGGLIVNGYVLGFVARRAVAQEGILILWRLLPHGVFELPAVLFSIGIGIRLGIELLKRDNWGKFKSVFVEAIRFFFFVVVPLLIVAGIIEGVLVFFVG